jgi:dienelactone hydrolase
MNMAKIAAAVVTVGTVCAAEIPDVLKTADGQTVTTPEMWEKVRRPEILELFKAHVFGRNPVERPDTLRFEALEPDKVMMDGKALRKRVAIRYSGLGGEGAIALTAFIPTKPAGGNAPAAGCPAFLLICNRPADVNIDPDRLNPSPFFPAEEIVARGYAALAFFNGDVDPDKHDGFTNGVHGVFQPDPAVRTADSWGTIAAWAWGASRVMDWIETEPSIDRTRVGVVGHSRGGKTALWTGATDTRFALTVSNDSGCGGAKLHRMDLPKSETVAMINKAFPHWFCGQFKHYTNNVAALPVDQHQLVALMAPRLVYVASATLDHWAGQSGEFQSCVLASPVWGLYGMKGLAGDVFPDPDTPLQDGRIGYHLRTGKHDLTVYDWQRFMDFFEKAAAR